jgi:hypothetical protein
LFALFSNQSVGLYVLRVLEVFKLKELEVARVKSQIQLLLDEFPELVVLP